MTLTNMTLLCLRDKASTMGAIFLQGPHQLAVKYTHTKSAGAAASTWGERWGSEGGFGVEVKAAAAVVVVVVEVAVVVVNAPRCQTLQVTQGLKQNGEAADDRTPQS